MRYGYFDDAAREYVITNPRTPVKWINYIGTLAFGGFVDHTGGALICKGDPSINRITKYIQQMPSSEFKGETLYVRFRGTDGVFRIFSPFFVPSLDPYDLYECHIGSGYTRIISEFYGIRTECTIFVPLQGTCEIRDINITNKSSSFLEIDVCPVIEYTHPNAVMQFTNADWVPQTMQSRMHTTASGQRILVQYPFMLKDTQINYFTSSIPSSSFETDRKRFLGDNEYGTWAHPRSLDQEELGNLEANRGDNIAALLHRLGTLKPGESKRLITQLGQTSGLQNALISSEKYRDGAAVNAAFSELAQSWERYLSTTKIETPDPAMNSMLGIHNPRQCFITYNWSRYLSYYQLGLGTRGLGFRDSSQDVMGIVDRIPDEAKKLIVKLLSVQNPDGSAMHQFNPLSMQASQGDAAERPDRPQYYGDDHLWIILAVSNYLKETGDLQFLGEEIPYYRRKSDQETKRDTVLGHLRAALDFTKSHMGAHGLPLLGFADWNDCVNLPGGAESLFNACLYGKALLKMIDLARHLGKEDWADCYRSDYDTMLKNVNAQAWDGAWYMRYFDADGTPLGSIRNEHGKIYLNGQSWPVLAGFASADRGRMALDSARKHLNTSKGLKLSTPGFNGFDPTKGGITTYPPGAKENGGIFLHTNPWMMIAETIMGDGDRAFEYYSQINPAAKNDEIDEYECEPYVYPQNILGDEHPQFGLARNSWLSGTSSWTYQAGTRYILGIRPDYCGLEIDPCIPKSWSGFTAERLFRGTVYKIEVRNPSAKSKGVASMIVDGKRIEGRVIPIAPPGSVVVVKIELG